MSSTTIHRMKCGCEFLEQLNNAGELHPEVDVCDAHLYYRIMPDMDDAREYAKKLALAQQRIEKRECALREVIECAQGQLKPDMLTEKQYWGMKLDSVIRIVREALEAE